MIAKEAIKDMLDGRRVIIKSKDYAYLRPHQALQNWISNYTITFPSAGIMSDEYTIIPHGCATLVFSFDGTKFASNLFGSMTKPVSVGSAANRAKLLFIVEFQPAGYFAFSGMPQNELTDTVISFVMLNPALNRLIAEQIEAAIDINDLIIEIDRLFLAHLKISYYRPELLHANRMIVESGGAISVKELSHSSFYSERQLGRIFGEYIGTSVKTFSRLVRVNKAIRLLRRKYLSVTQAYMQTGYYDMPHFINDFKSICGITPQGYRDNLSDFYNEIAKY